MWIMVIGATGSGKSVIASSLCKDGFELVESFDVETVGSREKGEIDLLMHRFVDYMKASDMAEKGKDVITIRSHFDQAETISRAMNDMTILDDENFDLVKRASVILKDSDGWLSPPDIVVYMNTSKMSSFDRMEMTGNNTSKDIVLKEISYLNKFVEKIKVPLIELDASESVEKLRSRLEYEIKSVRSAGVGRQTLWKRNFFR